MKNFFWVLNEGDLSELFLAGSGLDNFCESLGGLFEHTTHHVVVSRAASHGNFRFLELQASLDDEIDDDRFVFGVVAGDLLQAVTDLTLEFLNALLAGLDLAQSSAVNGCGSVNSDLSLLGFFLLLAISADLSF